MVPEKKNLLEGKKILAVDDERDVLATLEDLLPMCEVTSAATFEQAWELLGTSYFDLVILDIMGVDGYRLLRLAKDRGFTAVMLTAHAMNPENVKKSYEQGAALYIPKDKLYQIELFLKDVLEAKKIKKSTWWRWRTRFGSFFNKRFGTDWNELDKNFWDRF